jgi:hypothetical protein
MTSAKSYCLKLAGMVAVFVSLTVQAQATGLTEENIRNFYNEMIVINTTLREGQEDLPQLIEYLERTLSEDFVSVSNFRSACAAKPDKSSEITRQGIIDIYTEIGVNNYDVYDLNVVGMTITEEQDTAQVQFTLHIEDFADGNPFVNDIKVNASLIWDRDLQEPRVVSQVLDQTFIMKAGSKDCETSE